MTPAFDKEINWRAEIIARAYRLVGEWICKAGDISAAERSIVDAYLRAKIEFLVKLETVAVLAIEHKNNEDNKAVE
jgi:hypothetical protein